MSRKWIWLIVFAAAISVGYAVRGPAVSLFFQWYLKGYCRECLGSRLTYDSIHHENGKWVFEHPVLTTQKRLEKGGYSCQAERATIEVSISWLRHSLDLNVAMEAPHIDVGTGAEDLRSILERPSQKFHLFDVHTRYNVPQGTVLVHDFTEDHLVPVPLFFSVDLACRQTKEGCITLWLGQPTREGQDFSAIFSQKDPEKTQLSLDFQDVDCSSLQQVLRGLWPESASLQIVDGSLSGKLLISFPYLSNTHAEGKITVKNLKALNPDYGCEINIPDLNFHLSPKEVVSNGEKSINTIGNIDAPAATIVVMKDGAPFWTIDKMQGEVSFQTGDYAKFSVIGLVASNFSQRQLSIEGRGRFAEKGQTSFATDMRLAGQNTEEETELHFSARQLGEHWSFGEVELSGFGREELALIQHLLGSGNSEWQQLQIHRGNIDAAALVYLKGLHLSEVKVERIAANNLEFDFSPWNLSGSVESGIGSLSFDLLAEEPLKTLNADLNISQGSLNLEGLDKAKWEFSAIQTNLSVNKGVIQKSLMKGTMAGLQGEILLDGKSAGPLATLNFHGLALDFAQALPDTIRKGMEKKFKEDQLQIVAEATPLGDGLHFKGKIFNIGSNGGSEEIAFGFALEKTSPGLWRRWPPHPIAEDYCPGAGLEALHMMTPALAMPVNIVYRHLIKKELGFAGFGIKDGWFHANNMLLEKYISPFLFAKDQMQISGLGDFHGDFDGQKLVVHYDTRNMVVENSDFSAEIPRISLGAPAASQLIATCVYDFDKQTLFNTFPIHNGTYFEKNSGLLFTEINAKVSMENTVGHLSDVTVFCNGLYFDGAIDLDWSSPNDGEFDVGVKIQEMHGKVSQMKHFLSHINKNILLLKVPLEGNVALQKTGANLSFSFFNGGYDFKTHFPGKLSDGKLNGQNMDISLQELSLNFNYDHEGNTLDFTDIQGSLLVGKPNHMEEYVVNADRLHFTDYTNNEASFDFWVGDKKRDIMRLAGNTTTEIDVNGEPIINFNFDTSLSHFGNVHPSNFQLALKDWSQAELFNLEFEFQLKDLLSDLQKFSRTGLFFLSRNLLKELNDITAARGDFSAAINYEGHRGVVKYHVLGFDVAVGNQAFKKFLFTGTKKDSLWSVDQLQLDDISLACDVLKEGAIWNINFLGARIGSSLLIGLEGQYRDDDAHLDAKVNLLEANLADLSQWPSLYDSLGGQKIGGEIRASGTLYADFDKTLPRGVRLDAKMVGSFNNGSVKGLLLQDIQNMSFHYNSEFGFSLNEVFTGLKSINNEPEAGIFINRGSYDFVKHQLQIQGLHFEIPARNLEWISRHLQANFSNIISSSVADNIRNLKDQGSVQGVIDLTVSDPHSIFHLKLNDGLYNFMGRSHDIRNFLMEYTPFSLSISSDYLHQRLPLKLEARTNAPGFDAGEIVLSEAPRMGMGRQQMPLIIHWIKDPQTGIFIQKMTGTICGMTFDLALNPNAVLSQEALFLAGNLNVNLRHASLLLDEKLAASIHNWEIGDGYTLSGQWRLDKDESKALEDNITFQGELLGRDFEFLGYRLYNLYSQLTYSPQMSYIRNLTLSDGCGTMMIGQVDFTNQGDYWHTSIPQISFTNFRPSLLCVAKSSSPRVAKSMVIRQMDITNVQGILGERSSFTGSGQLTFINPPKRNLQHTIFAIPAELLTRIGLDMAVLTPVRGSVFFEIGNGRATITRFKDIYSKGRLSKFNLANNGYESYVDFDGNVHMEVRMKQYNLIFKLAELFTVTVQGTLKKPTYTLQKQHAHDDRTRNEVVQSR